MTIQFLRTVQRAVCISTVTGLTALTLSTNPASAAISASAKKCIDNVTKHYTGLKNPKPPTVLLVAAKNTCIITGNAAAAKGYFFQVSQPGLIKTANKLTIQIGSNFKKTVKEPGLLGLNGAENVLRALLTREAEYLWKEAKKRGGTPAPKPSPSGSITIQNVTLSDNYGLGTAPKDFAEAYIRLLKEKPGEATLLKARMFVKLKEIALGKGTRTKAETAYVSAMEGYIKKQYIKVAQSALDKYYAWQKETAAKKSASARSKNMASLFDYGEVPPDFLDEARAALALGAWGASTAAILTAVTGNVTATFGAIAPFAAKGSMAAVGLGAGMTTSAGAVAAAAAGPAAIVLASLVVGGIAIDQVVRQAKAEPKLKKAMAAAKSTPVSLKTMLNNRKGTEQVLYFFAKATSDKSPAGYTPPAEGCRVCLFDKPNFGGPSVCTEGRISNLKSVTQNGVTTKFNNKPSSVKLDTAKCPAAHVVLHEKSRFAKTKVVVNSSIADLKQLVRGKRANWNNVVSSVAFSTKAAPQCEMCLYDKPNFKGVYACAQGVNADLHALKMGDKAQSVLMRTKDCKAAKAWLYTKKDMKRTKSGGGVRVVTKSVSDLGKKWKNNISSVAFVPNGVNLHEEKASGGCRVCLYEHAKYKGGYICTDSKLANLKKTEPKFNNKTTSVQIITDACKKGDKISVSIYSKASYKGKATTLTSSLSKVGKEWKKAVSSIKFTRTSATTQAKKCEVCLYEHASYKGKSFCIGKNIEKLSSKKFANKASSLKFNKGGCEKAYIRLYEKAKYKSDIIKITKNVANLGKLQRKKKKHWNDVSGSLKFYKK